MNKMSGKTIYLQFNRVIKTTNASLADVYIEK